MNITSMETDAKTSHKTSSERERARKRERERGRERKVCVVPEAKGKAKWSRNGMENLYLSQCAKTFLYLNYSGMISVEFLYNDICWTFIFVLALMQSKETCSINVLQHFYFQNFFEVLSNTNKYIEKEVKIK